MEKKHAGVMAALETPTGLRFPSIEASRPAAAPVLEEYFGFMYIGEMLKEWRVNNQEDASLERLLTEASLEHLLWEAERANQELILFLNREGVVDKVLQYAFSGDSSGSPVKEATLSLDAREAKIFCQELLSLEVKQGGVFDDSGQTRIIHHLFSSFFTLEDENGKPLRLRAPPPEAGTLLQVLAYRPQSREKVLSYLVDTPAELFVDFFLTHLDHVIVSDVLTTLVSLLSEATPSAWLPTGGPRVLQLHLSEFDVDPGLVAAFDEWLIAGSFVDRLIAAILHPQSDDHGSEHKDQRRRRRTEVIEKAFGLLGQVAMIARSHWQLEKLPPGIFFEFVERSRLMPFLSSVLQHTDDKVLSEGLALLSSLLVCDRMREGEKRRRADEQPATDDHERGLRALATDASAWLNGQEGVVAQDQGDDPRIELNPSRKSHQQSTTPRGSRRKGASDKKKEDALLDSHLNAVLVEALKDALPVLLQRIRLEMGQQTDDGRQGDGGREAQQAEGVDAVASLEGGQPSSTDRARPAGEKPRKKRIFGLLRLKIMELMRALVLHFTAATTEDKFADAFFKQLESLAFPTLLVDLLAENPMMDILHTVIIQTLKPILTKEKTRAFLHAVIREGSFIRQIVQILPLCGLASACGETTTPPHHQASAELEALRPPVREIMSCLTRTSLTDIELGNLLHELGWWEQAGVVSSSGTSLVLPTVPFA